MQIHFPAKWVMVLHLFFVPSSGAFYQRTGRSDNTIMAKTPTGWARRFPLIKSNTLNEAVTCGF